MGSSSRYLAASIAAYLARVYRAFFGIAETDSSVVKGLKVADRVLRRTVYAVADYWTMALSATFIILMDKQFGYGPVGLFLLMWAFDIIVANAFVVIWKKTGKDVTLAEDYRRATDVIYHGSKVAGMIAFAGVVIKATFWDGPEHIVIFFRKEIETEARMLASLLVLTAIQAAIWTPIYLLGFDSAVDLYNHLRQLMI